MKIFNFLKSNRPEETKEAEVVAVENKATSVESVSSLKKPEGENFSERLDGLKKAMEEMESHGLQMDENVFANIMQMSVGDFMEYVNGGNNIKEKDIKSLHENISQILNGQLSEAYSGSRLKEFLRKPASKIAFVTLLLFLKFAPHSQANEAPVKDVGDADTKTEKYSGGGTKAETETEKSTYVAGAEDFASAEMGSVANMDLTSSYETDKAIIGESETSDIKADFKSFLDKIDSHNFSEVIKLDFKIYGSSDERPTASWKGGNLELTQARIDAVEKIMTAELAKHDFSNSDLSPEQIKALQGKEFKHSLPDDGMTHIADLTNPDTGEKYTAKEVNEMKKNDIAKYNELLKTCRYIKVNLLAKAGEEIKPVPNLSGTIEVKASEDSPQKIVQLISEYDQTVIIFDNSLSMKNSKDYMAQKLQAVDRGANIKIATFSDKLNAVTEVDNFVEAGDVLKKVKNTGKSNEKSVLAATEALKSFDVSGEKIMESKLLLINTDEAIQSTKAEMDKLLAESQKKGVKVYFNLGIDDNKQVVMISLEKALESFQEGYDSKLKKVNSDINKAKTQLATKTVKGEVRRVVEDRLESLEKQLAELTGTELVIKDFKADNGTIIRMTASR